MFVQGEYYNADELHAMLAAEMSDERKKREEMEAQEEDFDNIMAEDGQVRAQKKDGDRSQGKGRRVYCIWGAKFIKFNNFFQID